MKKKDRYKMKEEKNDAVISNIKTDKFDRFTVQSETVTIDGKSSPFSFILMKEGVCILPFVGKKVLVAREYRYPVESWQYELPGGGIEDGESVMEAAARELLEETGFKALKIERLGYFHPSFGSTNEKIHLVAAYCDEERGKTHFDGTEQISCELISMAEFEKLAVSEEFNHAAGMAAWLRFIGKYPDRKK